LHGAAKLATGPTIGNVGGRADARGATLHKALATSGRALARGTDLSASARIATSAAVLAVATSVHASLVAFEQTWPAKARAGPFGANLATLAADAAPTAVLRIAKRLHAALATGDSARAAVTAIGKRRRSVRQARVAFTDRCVQTPKRIAFQGRSPATTADKQHDPKHEKEGHGKAAKVEQRGKMFHGSAQRRLLEEKRITSLQNDRTYLSAADPKVGPVLNVAG
jgi:hypothetical protein